MPVVVLAPLITGKIPLLVTYFVQRLGSAFGRRKSTLSEGFPEVHMSARSKLSIQPQTPHRPRSLCYPSPLNKATVPLTISLSSSSGVASTSLRLLECSFAVGMGAHPMRSMFTR